eukprot:COSAG02_NODE_52621_length_306_cov_1.714976_1_plen_43_part_01
MGIYYYRLSIVRSIKESSRPPARAAGGAPRARGGRGSAPAAGT